MAVIFIIAICDFLSYVGVNFSVLNPFKEALESYKLTDLYFSAHSNEKVPVYDGMSVVLVDVSSCKTRGEVADVIERINAAEPRLVALDIIFPEAVSSNEEEDRHLVEALDNVENLVLACELRPVSDSEYELKRSFFADMIDAEEGAVSFPGKVVRSWCPLILAGGDTIPSLSKVIADKLSIPIPSSLDAQLIDYAIVDTMKLGADEEWSADFLEGQVVLGGDVNDLRDTYQVPVTLKTSVRKSGVLIKLYNEFTGENDPELAKKIARSMETVTAAAYKKAIVEGQVNGEIRTDIDPGMAAYLVDNILINVQFSYACDYYSERYRIYAGEDVFEKDEFVIENILRFIKAALKMNENL